jgi:hypothetical protein
MMCVTSGFAGAVVVVVGFDGRNFVAIPSAVVVESISFSPAEQRQVVVGDTPCQPGMYSGKKQAR